MSDFSYWQRRLRHKTATAVLSARAQTHLALQTPRVFAVMPALIQVHIIITAPSSSLSPFRRVIYHHCHHHHMIITISSSRLHYAIGPCPFVIPCDSCTVGRGVKSLRQVSQTSCLNQGLLLHPQSPTVFGAGMPLLPAITGATALRPAVPCVPDLLGAGRGSIT